MASFDWVTCRLHFISAQIRPAKKKTYVQLNLCQKLLFLQNMGRTCCVHELFWMSIQKLKTIYVHNMFSTCSKLVLFMYWTCNSMNNLLSYCGLVDAKIRASDKNLPVKYTPMKTRRKKVYPKRNLRYLEEIILLKMSNQV